jgi:hypothetical protein
MNETIVKIIRSYSDKFTEAKFFFAPGIPPKKLKNAINAYASGLSEDDVLLLLDTTLFGSGKDGLLLSEDTLYVHNSFSKPRKIPIKDIQRITLEETEVAEFESMDIHVNDPEFRGIADINEKDARQFTQMLQEVKVALMPAGAGSAESELIVNEVSRESRIEQARMVPVEAGKLRRYSFVNLHLRGRDLGKVENSNAGFFSHPKVFLEKIDNKVYARAEGNDVTVNGEALVGKRELADRDRIGLGKDKDLAVYEYQANAVTAKQLRQKEEEAQGIVRHAGAQKPSVVMNSRFVIDPKGIELKDDQDGRKLSWNEVDEIAFSADYDFLYKATTNLGNAAGQGMAIGAQTAVSFLESVRLSDLKAVFPAPIYKVEFFSKGASFLKLEKFDQRACTMFDEGIEFFGPMDLVKFK